jgi:hypothetical protein
MFSLDEEFCATVWCKFSRGIAIVCCSRCSIALSQQLVILSSKLKYAYTGKQKLIEYALNITINTSSE